MGQLSGSVQTIKKRSHFKVTSLFVSFTIWVFRTIERKYMDNDIINILNLYDTDCEASLDKDENGTKYITVRKAKKIKYCPYCGSRLYSHGLFKRHPKHQIYQCDTKLNITVEGRNWDCSNSNCDYTERDLFEFIEPYKQNTKIQELSILHEMKDLHKTCVQIANQYGVSDTYVHDLFSRYVDLPRLKLTPIISIDEVYLNIDNAHKYALIIMDFTTGNIIDILSSRRETVTSSYFSSIPKEERDIVKYVICDMYQPYAQYTLRYFHNAVPVTDSFHVIQWCNNYINTYINQVRRHYLERDRKLLETKNKSSNRLIAKQIDSDEVYILKKAKWVLLMADDNIHYSAERHYNKFFDQYLDTYDWINKFMDLDVNFREIKVLKDKYIDFNREHINNRAGAEADLEKLIQEYLSSPIKIFNEFAKILKRWKVPILNSFTYISTTNENGEKLLRRLSNGPTESYNNNPSSYRTNSRGLSDFLFTRNRLLWSARFDAAILGNPKTYKDIRVSTNNSRGSYNKK